MKNNKIKIYGIALVVSLFTFLIYSHSQQKYYLDKDKFIDWVQFNTNGILVICGFFITILTFVITLQNNQLAERNRKNQDIVKIKVLLRKEIERYIKTIDYVANLYSYNVVMSGADTIIYIDIEKIHTFDDKVKEALYDLMRLDDSSEVSAIYDIFVDSLDKKYIFKKMDEAISQFGKVHFLEELVYTYLSSERKDIYNHIGLKKGQQDFAQILEELKDDEFEKIINPRINNIIRYLDEKNMCK
ncbi:MAG: hypothetical protein ACRC1T_17540 [Clostridium chrysemydis]|uniref:hypothetical protein n=1 Tax=Clostridium chrysemydis TaxID=2665504 RepID=UPI003F36F570